MPGGRPTDYSPELAGQICQLIIDGSNLSKISKKKGMPGRDSIHRWLGMYSEFSDKYIEACRMRREYKFEMLEATVLKYKEPARARLMVDVIKWQLSKEEPKKYGDKVDVTSDGEKLGRGMSDDELDAIIARAAGHARNKAG